MSGTILETAGKGCVTAPCQQQSRLQLADLESDRLLSVMPVAVTLYNQGEYAMYCQAKAEGVAL